MQISLKFPLLVFFAATTQKGEGNCAGKIDYTTLDREGQNAKAEELLDTYGDRLMRLAFSYLHNREDAEEIVQDAVIAILRARPVFENGKHECAYLMATASNLAKNRIKQNARHQTTELNEEITAEEEEDKSFMLDACAHLPEKYREVIHLFYCEDFSTAEIAKILKTKEGTVRSNLNRGREKLRTILKEEYGCDF